MSLTLFWFRRDLRFSDNTALYQALRDSDSPVQPVFIFDTGILRRFANRQDARVSFLHHTLRNLKDEFRKMGSDLWILHGEPQKIFSELFSKHAVKAVFCNEDYEPRARERDERIREICAGRGASFCSFKDQVIFEKSEVLSGEQKPYTVYTPYKKKWLASLDPFYLKSYPTEKYAARLSRAKTITPAPTLLDLGYEPTPDVRWPALKLDSSLLKKYEQSRDFPAQDATTRLGIHLRFGTLSIRAAARAGLEFSGTWLSELIWREFFMQILFHFPHVETSSFRPEYEKVKWRTSREDFQRWLDGETGYPLVDAGMRQMRATGYMHNRARMVTASFLTKHLLIHWREGEAAFSQWLLDYELASNNGNWQWAAGTGCDAAPYFRIFNPEAQAKRFDPENEYIRQWVPEFSTARYPRPMVDHAEARVRALRAFSDALKSTPKSGSPPSRNNMRKGRIS